MSHLKTVCRTLFYQYFILLVGISIGFITNAEWIGWKSSLITRSINNIFFPIEFNEELCQKIKNFGAYRLYALSNYPQNFTIIEDGLLAEEFYIAKFSYVNENGKTIETIESTRVRWKSWEYYYDEPKKTTLAELYDYMENGTLNSKESDKAYKLYRELKEMNSAKVST